MKTIVVTALFMFALATAGAVSSSPGGLDGRGGHHCWTNCSKWGKYRGQYHCHRAPCNARDIARHRRHGH